MRRLALTTLALFAAMPFCGISKDAASQDTEAARLDPALVPLQKGTLVVWIVYPSRAKLTPGSALAYTQYNEQSPSTFGQASSNVGANAGDTGQTSSSFGASASSTGTAASNAGQTAGSFGVSSTDLPAVAAAANGSAPTLHLIAPKHDPTWDDYEQKLRSAFPDLQVTFVDVSADDLLLRLFGRLGTQELDFRRLMGMLGRGGGGPDVYVGNPLVDVSAMGGMATLGVVPWLEQIEREDSPGRRKEPETAISTFAAHPDEARAFITWLRNGPECSGCRDLPREALKPAQVATDALRSVLQGLGIGVDADPQMAEFSAQAMQAMALGPNAASNPVGVQRAMKTTARGANFPSGSATSLTDLRIDIANAQANARFAAVELRAVAIRGAAFVAHAVVLLRTDETGRWRVLQISPNLQPVQQETAWGELEPFAHIASPEQVLGISEAAPPDGDNRSPRPDLWWDNKGGARLQVVEWQTNAGSSWSGSNLYFVLDDHFIERTRTTARFAKMQGGYRWRIWSVGTGGTVVLSPWRTLNIVGR